MTKLAKKVTALACAMLMTVGAASQVSAGSIIFNFYGSTVRGTAQKESTTVASATTSYSGIPTVTGFNWVTIYVRAYVNVNGVRQFGTEGSASSQSTSASVTENKTVSGGVGTTGYGGEHQMIITYRADAGYFGLSSGDRYSNY